VILNAKECREVTALLFAQKQHRPKAVLVSVSKKYFCPAVRF